MALQKISYTADGEKYDLTESNNFVVVRTKKGKPLPAALLSKGSKQTAGKFNVKQKIERAGITILEVKKNQTDPLAVRNKAREQFKKEKAIDFAGRVLVDKETGEPVLYTENIFIQLKPGISKEAAKKIFKDLNLTEKESITYAANTYFVSAAKGTGTKIFDICKQLKKKKEVLYCEPELIRKAGKKKVNAPKIYYRQWHLAATKIGARKINAGAAVDKAHFFTKGVGTIIAIIDDGVDTRHKEFSTKGKIIAPFDVSYKTNNALPKLRDDNHGTCCAGVACAAGIGKACGVAPEAKLIPIRNVSELGSKDEADAIVWAVDNGADVISCSWGPEDGEWWNPKDKLHGHRHPISPLTNDAINYAVTKGRGGKGCVILFAAGNGNENADPDKYINHPGIIAVAACNDRGKKSVYSDFGKSIWVCFPSNDFEHKPFKHPAPLTKGIWTIDRVGKAGHKRKSFADYCDNFGGTSSACPGAAGVCALMIAANPALTYKDVKDILRLTADKIDTPKGNYNDGGHSEWYGYGRVHAAKAVELAMKWKISNPV
jgi:subtilisin family serine protease